MQGNCSIMNRLERRNLGEAPKCSHPPSPALSKVSCPHPNTRLCSPLEHFTFSILLKKNVFKDRCLVLAQTSSSLNPLLIVSHTLQGTIWAVSGRVSGLLFSSGPPLPPPLCLPHVSGSLHRCMVAGRPVRGISCSTAPFFFVSICLCFRVHSESFLTIRKGLLFLL